MPSSWCRTRGAGGRRSEAPHWHVAVELPKDAGILGVSATRLGAPLLSPSTSPLRQSVRFLKRQGWLIVLVPVLAVAASAYFVHRQHSVYRASMGIVVAQAAGPNVDPLGSQQLSQTMSGVLTSNVVARTAIASGGLPVSSGTLLNHLSVAVNPESSVLEVSYDASSKREALDTLTAVRTAFESVAKTLGVSTNLNQRGALRIVASVFDPPHALSSPVAPHPVTIMSFAGVLGLALGLILAFARESLDDRVREPRDAEEWFGAPVIGALPRGWAVASADDDTQERGGLKRALNGLRAKLRLRRGERGATALVMRTAGDSGAPVYVVADEHTRGRLDDALDVLGANLQLRSRELGRTLLVTSTADDDGASADVVARLGVALAQGGQDVLCVDANFREPRLWRVLTGRKPNGDWASGLEGLLLGDLDLEQAMRRVKLRSSNGDGRDVPAGKLAVLAASTATAEQTALLSPPRLSELVETVSARPGYVLIAAPPLLSAAHAISLASAVEGVLVVARRGRTRREPAEAIRVALEQGGVRHVALVLLDARKPQVADTHSL